MTEEEFVFGSDSDRKYLKTVEDKDEKYFIGQEIRSRKGFLKRLPPEVKTVFLRNHIRDYNSDTFTSDSNEFPDPYFYDTKRTVYYVYEIYTHDDNKVCFIGYSRAPNHKPDLSFIDRDRRFRILKEKKGLSIRILIDNLNEFQSVVYADSCKKGRVRRGEILLNYDSDKSRANLDDATVRSKGIPFIYKNNFLKYFFENEYKEEVGFDAVTYNSLKCTYFLHDQKRAIVDWLMEKNARILRTVGKSVKSIIVSPYIDYFDFRKYKENGIKILSAKDVMEFVMSNKELPPFNNTHIISRLRINNPQRRDYIREYLRNKSTVIEEYYQFMRNNDFPIMSMQQPLSLTMFQNDLPMDVYRNDIEYILMWTASYLRDGNADRIIDIYIKRGLYKEALPFLEKDDSRAADYYYYSELSEL